MGLVSKLVLMPAIILIWISSVTGNVSALLAELEMQWAIVFSKPMFLLSSQQRLDRWLLLNINKAREFRSNLREAQWHCSIFYLRLSVSPCLHICGHLISILLSTSLFWSSLQRNCIGRLWTCHLQLWDRWYRWSLIIALIHMSKVFDVSSSRLLYFTR